MKPDVTKKLNAILTDAKKNQSGDLKITGRVLKKSGTSIEFAGPTGVVIIPVGEIIDMSPIKSEEKAHAGIVELSLRSFSRIRYKFRIPGTVTGFSGDTPTAGWIDTATITYRGTPDATDDVIDISRVDDHWV